MNNVHHDLSFKNTFEKCVKLTKFTLDLIVYGVATMNFNYGLGLNCIIA